MRRMFYRWLLGRLNAAYKAADEEGRRKLMPKIARVDRRLGELELKRSLKRNV